jgi:hypothetical protein
MTKRAWILGVIAASAVLSTGCSTLPRANAGGAGEVEEVDMLADVELTDSEAAAVAVAPAPQRENSTEVSWTPNGKNIQLAKLPKVQPVTASMLTLDKRLPLLAPPQAAKTDGASAPRSLSK